MSSSSFNEAVFVDKLSKLNASQQSIETLSNWCIFHRKRARQLVATWQERFFSVAAERRLPLLYLCNDIIQNSRKKGPEFIAEFWTALPSVLQELMRAGPDNARKAAYRIVDIWEERKVFGHKDDALRVLLLGPELAAPALASAAAAPEAAGPASQGGAAPSRAPSAGRGPAGETSERPAPGTGGGQVEGAGPSSSAGARPSRHEEPSSKGHSPSHRAKVRGALERLSNAYSAVQDSAKDEDTALRRCSVAVNEVQSLEKDVLSIAAAAPEGVWAPVRDRLDTKLALLGTCCEQMGACETKRAFLVKLLQEALSTQESKLDRLRSQLQVGRAHAEQLSKLRARVPSAPPAPSSLVTISAPASSSADPLVPLDPLDRQGTHALPATTMEGSAAPAGAALRPNGSGPLGSASAGSWSSAPLGSASAGSWSSAPLGPASAGSWSSAPLGSASAGSWSSAPLASASAPASTSGEELMAHKRQVAAQLAAKVRASTSSAAILSQVLSTLAAKGASMAASAAAAPAPSLAPPPSLAPQQAAGAGVPYPTGAGVPYPVEKKPRLEPHPGAGAPLDTLEAGLATAQVSEAASGPPGFPSTTAGGAHLA